MFLFLAASKLSTTRTSGSTWSSPSVTTTWAVSMTRIRCSGASRGSSLTPCITRPAIRMTYRSYSSPSRLITRGPSRRPACPQIPGRYTEPFVHFVSIGPKFPEIRGLAYCTRVTRAQCTTTPLVMHHRTALVERYQCTKFRVASSKFPESKGAYACAKCTCIARALWMTWMTLRMTWNLAVSLPTPLKRLSHPLTYK